MSLHVVAKEDSLVGAEDQCHTINAGMQWHTIQKIKVVDLEELDFSLFLRVTQSMGGALEEPARLYYDWTLGRPSGHCFSFILKVSFFIIRQGKWYSWFFCTFLCCCQDQDHAPILIYSGCLFESLKFSLALRSRNNGNFLFFLNGQKWPVLNWITTICLQDVPFRINGNA